ncbi:MAG TPA: hypothetical protein VK742_20270 [Candidatus Sulfotelmatobacter sp.]|jgi:hypothetical protein|nr:hypothetical protein [Candidatus Sulfotelmatobacter sp.]
MTRELFTVAKHYFAIRTADGKFSILGSTKRKPKLPPGAKLKGPYRFRDSATRCCLLWSTAK